MEPPHSHIPSYSMSKELCNELQAGSRGPACLCVYACVGACVMLWAIVLRISRAQASLGRLPGECQSF